MKASSHDVFLTEQEIEEKYSSNEAKIAIKKFDRIQYLIESGYEQLDKFKHEDISVFIGNTRCGKSTVVNVAIGNKLITRKEKLKVSLVIDDAQDNMPGPVIGNKSVSETTIPGRYESLKDDFGIIWDCPGFADNRGVTQDIANSFYIQKLFENARSTKIYLVTDFADISSDSIKGFIDMTQSLELMFAENISKLIDKNSIAMIITKANIEEFDADDIKDHYREYFLGAKGMNKGEYAEKLVNYLLDNDDTIAILPKIKNINHDINEQLLQPLKQLGIEYINVKNHLAVQPSLSAEAAKFIYTYYNDGVVLSEFKHFFQEVLGLQKITKAKLDQVRDKKWLKHNLDDCRQKSDILDKLGAELQDTTSLEDASKIIMEHLPDCLQIENSVEYIKKYFQDHSIISKSVFLDFLTSSVLRVTNTLQPMIKTFLGVISIGYAKEISNIRQILGEITEEENIQKQQELVKELQESRDRHETSIKENQQKLNEQAAQHVKEMKQDQEKYLKHREELQNTLWAEQKLRDAEHKKEMLEASNSNKEEIIALVKKVAELENRPPQIIRETIYEDSDDGCTIFNVTKEQYDNPLLNEHELLSKIYEKFGSKKCDDFISLTSILDAQEVQDIIDSQEPLDIIGAMLNC